MARRKRSNKKLTLMDRHRPSSAILHRCRRIDVARLCPGNSLAVGVNIRQRQRPTPKLSPMDRQSHHLQLFAQPARIFPRPLLIETIDPSTGPSADIQTTAIVCESIRLRVLSHRPKSVHESPSYR